MAAGIWIVAAATAPSSVIGCGCVDVSSFSIMFALQSNLQNSVETTMFSFTISYKQVYEKAVVVVANDAHRLCVCAIITPVLYINRAIRLRTRYDSKRCDDNQTYHGRA